jgi:hypothetical protein
MKHNLKIIVNLFSFVSNQLINHIHIQFRFVLPAADVTTVLPCYSYGIIFTPMGIKVALYSPVHRVKLHFR